MRHFRRDRDRPYWPTSVAMGAALLVIRELVRRFTALPESTGLVVAGGLWAAFTWVPAWLAYRSRR